MPILRNSYEILKKRENILQNIKGTKRKKTEKHKGFVSELGKIDKYSYDITPRASHIELLCSLK